MRPKDAASPKLLAAGGGSLLAMPGAQGQAMLQWAQANTEPCVPQVGHSLVWG